MADNAGGGAASDSTFVLRALVENGLSGVALGAIWDQAAARLCADAGVGSTLAMRIGGKCGPASGDPLDLVVTVRAARADHAQTGLGGARHAYGLSAWVRTAAGIDVVLISTRQQVIGTDLFTGLGIALTDKTAVVVKSARHFHEAFAPIAAEVLYADTPGLLSSDFAALRCQKRRPFRLEPSRA